MVLTISQKEWLKVIKIIGKLHGEKKHDHYTTFMNDRERFPEDWEFVDYLIMRINVLTLEKIWGINEQELLADYVEEEE
tara:strand:- start:1244 stop:1480 length:237 start_codon:yes stop_codon:yes gene_type:complete